jgi:hypothetical protein
MYPQLPEKYLTQLRQIEQRWISVYNQFLDFYENRNAYTDFTYKDFKKMAKMAKDLSDAHTTRWETRWKDAGYVVYGTSNTTKIEKQEL